MPWPALTKEINDFILFHCSTSPMALHNQIAVACRSTNIMWRRIWRRVLLDCVSSLIITIIREADSETVMQNVVWPLEDILDQLWDKYWESMNPWGRAALRYIGIIKDGRLYDLTTWQRLQMWCYELCGNQGKKMHYTRFNASLPRCYWFVRAVKNILPSCNFVIWFWFWKLYNIVYSDFIILLMVFFGFLSFILWSGGG